MKVMVNLDLPSHPKILSLSKELSVTRDRCVTSQEALGFVVTLWCWTMKFREDGNLSELTDEHISEASGWEGDPRTFVQSMIKCGFIDRKPWLQVHDWQDNQGKLIKKRALDSERQRRYRESKRDRVEAEPDTRDVTRDVTRDMRDKSVTPSPLPLPLPERERGDLSDTVDLSRNPSSSAPKNPPLLPSAMKKERPIQPSWDLDLWKLALGAGIGYYSQTQLRNCLETWISATNEEFVRSLLLSGDLAGMDAVKVIDTIVKKHGKRQKFTVIPKDEVDPCQTCKGTRYVFLRENGPDGREGDVAKKCPACLGTGEKSSAPLSRAYQGQEG